MERARRKRRAERKSEERKGRRDERGREREGKGKSGVERGTENDKMVRDSEHCGFLYDFLTK